MSGGNKGKEGRENGNPNRNELLELSNLILVDEEDENLAVNRPPAVVWWESLQKKLDDGGCRLDLNAPEDMLRIFSFEISVNEEGEYVGTPKLAFDPSGRFLADIELTEENLLGTQQPPTLYTLNQLYAAAKQGRLMVTSAEESDRAPRQILVAPDGKAKLGNDLYSSTEEEALCGSMRNAPVKPASPGFFNRFLAFFGNKKAKAIIEDYNGKMEQYTGDLQTWNRIEEKRRTDPDFVLVNQNKTAIQMGSYAFGNEHLINFGKLAFKMHKDSEYRKLPEDSRNVKLDENDKMFQITNHTKELVEMLMTVQDNKQPLDEEVQNELAFLLYARSELARGKTMLEAGSGAEFVPLKGEAFENALNEYRRSEEFTQLVSVLNFADLRPLSVETSKIKAIDAIVRTAQNRLFPQEEIDHPENAKEIRLENELSSDRVENKAVLPKI